MSDFFLLFPYTSFFVTLLSLSGNKTVCLGPECELICEGVGA